MGNGGTANIFVPYSVSLWLDEELVDYWIIEPPHLVGYFLYAEDVIIGPLPAGTYTLTLWVDDEDDVYESNELDNFYQKTIEVGSQRPNLRPYQPAGWPSAAVVSIEQNSQLEPEAITTEDQLFLDWAVLNDGEVNVDSPYDITLVLDGAEKKRWRIDPPHQSNYFVSVKDFPLGPLAAGTHRLQLRVDPGGGVDESNETDNELSREIRVQEPADQGQIVLLFPRVQTDPLRRTGIAVANPTGTPADVSMMLLDRFGNLRSGSGVTNPAEFRIPPGGQLARTIPELFGTPSAAAGDWVFATSSNLGLVGFFLSFNADVSGIDGAEAISLLGTPALVFPEILCEAGAVTELNLIGYGEVDVELRSAGGEKLASKVLTLPADQPGNIASTVEQLFGRKPPCDSYVLAVGRKFAVYGFELFGTASSLGGRNAIPVRTSGLSGTQSLFGAQLADTSSIRTFVTLINPTDTPARLTLSAFRTGVAGTTPAAARVVDLGPGAMLRREARALLQLPPGEFVGWLRVDSDVLGVVGDLSFGDAAGSFLSSVQLQHTPVTDLVFSHVADGLGYLTGLTFVNPSRDAASISLKVFSKEGLQTGASQFILQPFEHRPRLLGELVAGLPPQIGGYIRIQSNVGIYTFELFSFVEKGKLKSLAAVPPQRGKGLISGLLIPSQVGSATAVILQPADRYPQSLSKGIRLDPGGEFVAGEAIVRLEDPAMAAGFSMTLPAELSPSVVMGGDSMVLVRAGTGGQAGPAAQDAMETETRKLATLALVEELNGQPGVLYAVPNFIRHADRVPDDPGYSFQWHYPQIHLPEVWDITTGSPNVIAAIIDTGARFDHPDLGPRLTGGQYDFISDRRTANDGDGMDGSAQDPGDDPAASKSSFHGTHVAGTIGAVTNNGQGVAGVNWQSPLMTLRVLGVGGGTDWDIMQALKYAARLANSSGQLPARKANVVNMSLSGPQDNPALGEVVAAVLAQGVAIVAAAGNTNSDQTRYPAGYAGVISVGAIDLSGGKAPYSCFGPRVDVVAPGGNVETDLNGDDKVDGVLSTLWNGETNQPSYIFYQGTSMAAPHVTGIVSLMLSVNPAPTPGQIREILQQTAVDLGAAGRDNTYGYGLVDPVAAVRRAAGQSPSQPKLLVSNSDLDFGTQQSQLTFTVSNGGGGQLTLNAPQVEVDTGQGWLTARLSDQSVVVQVLRQGLAAGAYSGRVRLGSNGGTATVNVKMQVGQAPPPPVGTLYVIALDPVNFDSVSGTETTAQEQFRYVLPAMDVGACLVAAGSDDDEDGYICGEGELCGFYPVFGDAVNVTVEANATTRNIDFAVYRRNSSASAGPALRPGRIRIPRLCLQPPAAALSPASAETAFARCTGSTR